MSQKMAWLLVLIVASLAYAAIVLGQSALGLESLFHQQLAIGDERRAWVVLSTLVPFVVALGLCLTSTALSESGRGGAVLGSLVVYGALIGNIVMEMSGALYCILPLTLPLGVLTNWLGLRGHDYLPIHSTPAQDVVVPALIALGLAITVVGLAQVVVAAKKQALATRGLYGTMRHPQHLGITLWALGIALWGSSVLDVLVWFSLVYVLVLLAWQEELRLQKRFGADYDAYRRGTPFMMPILPKKGVLLGEGNDREIAVVVGAYPAGVALVIGLFYFLAIQ